MPHEDHRRLISGARVVSLGTLTSRVLGMLRDMTTAALLGLSAGGVMDAFVIGFRIPNMFRRLFGEGALTASYLPVLTKSLDQDRKSAWQLASVSFLLLAVVLAAVVVVSEGVCLGVLSYTADDSRVSLVAGLTAVMLPYLFFICLAAHLSATLHALGHFAAPALVPVILNVCWLTAAWLVAPWLADDKPSQAFVLAAAVLVAGVLQLAFQVPVVRALGVRFDYDWAASRRALGEIVRGMGPTMLGLAVTQVNTFLDSMLAWGLSAPPGSPADLTGLTGSLPYPLEAGATAAIYYGERLYQFPLGVLGLAVATAIFPLLSRHAARGMHERLGADLTVGLRLVLFLSLPAAAGLVILAEPIARVLFERGAFTPSDTVRTARMIACYGVGVCAYCALPVAIRGYYAMGDRLTPVRIGMVTIALNLTLNLFLVWPLAEAGLAISTAICAAIQTTWLLVVFSRRLSRIGWGELLATGTRTLVSTLLMAAATLVTLWLLPATNRPWGHLIGLLVPCGVALGVFYVSAWVQGQRELGLLGFSRRDRDL